MKARSVGRMDTWKVDRKASKEREMKGTEAEFRQSLSIMQRSD